MKKYFRRLWKALINKEDSQRLKLIAEAPAAITGMVEHKGYLFIATADGLYCVKPDEDKPRDLEKVELTDESTI